MDAPYIWAGLFVFACIFIGGVLGGSSGEDNPDEPTYARGGGCLFFVFCTLLAAGLIAIGMGYG